MSREHIQFRNSRRDVLGSYGEEEMRTRRGGGETAPTDQPIIFLCALLAVCVYVCLSAWKLPVFTCVGWDKL